MMAQDLPQALAELGGLLRVLHDRFVRTRPEAERRTAAGGGLWADLCVERAFHAACRRRWPDGVLFVGEETGASGRRPVSAHEIVVFIDPIDGTELLKAGQQTYASTFAIGTGHELLGGAIYLPDCDRVIAVAASPAPTRPRRRQSALVAMGSRDQFRRPRLAQDLRRAGFDVTPMGCTARRLLDLAAGDLRAVVKTVGWRSDHPRLWGCAAGLLACREAGVELWFSPSRRLLVAGDRQAAHLAIACDATDLAAAPLDEIYRALWRPPLPRTEQERQT